jgi:hypothetical protein
VLVEEGKSDRLVSGVARGAPATDEIRDEDHDDERRETHSDNDRNEIAVARVVGEALFYVAIEFGGRRIRLEGLQLEASHGERCHRVVEGESFLRLAEVILAVLHRVKVAFSVLTKHWAWCAWIAEAVERVHLVEKREVLRVVVGVRFSRVAHKDEGKRPAVVEVHSEILLFLAAAALHSQTAEARVDVQRVRQVGTSLVLVVYRELERATNECTHGAIPFSENELGVIVEHRRSSSRLDQRLSRRLDFCRGFHSGSSGNW